MDINKEKFIELFNSGYTNIQLADFFNCSLSSIKVRKHKWTLSKNIKWTSSKDTYLKSLINGTIKDASISLGCSYGAIQKRAKILNINFKHETSYTKNDINTIRTMHNNLYSVDNISKRLNRSIASIYVIASKNNINLNNYNIRYTNFINKIKDMDIYLLSDFTGVMNKINCKCKVCGNIWDTTPNSMYRGCGCPVCAIDPTKQKSTYFLYFQALELYKIGISNNINKRQNELGYESELIFFRQFENGQEAYKLEQKWLSNIEHLKVNIGLLKSGNTETFKDE